MRERALARFSFSPPGYFYCDSPHIRRMMRRRGFNPDHPDEPNYDPDVYMPYGEQHFSTVRFVGDRRGLQYEEDSLSTTSPPAERPIFRRRRPVPRRGGPIYRYGGIEYGNGRGNTNHDGPGGIRSYGFCLPH